MSHANIDVSQKFLEHEEEEESRKLQPLAENSQHLGSSIPISGLGNFQADGTVTHPCFHVGIFTLYVERVGVVSRVLPGYSSENPSIYNL